MAISLCMIVKDEADHLPRCLTSVAGYVDECIVLDTGSTDGTVALAQGGGATVHQVPWPNDFAAARNQALAHATGDWLLVLDADEVLLPEAGAALRRIDQGEPYQGIPADTLLLVNLMRLEVGAPQSPYSLVSRFFRRLPAVRFERPYHETVDDSVLALQRQQPHWQLATLDGVALHHYGYTAAAVARRNKTHRARTLMEQYLATHPQDSYLLNKLAALYVQEGDPALALPCLTQALAHLDGHDPATAYELYFHRGLLHRQQQALPQAVADYQQAITQPILPALKLGAYLNLGSALTLLGQPDAAITVLTEAAAIDPSYGLTYYNLGVAHRRRGDLPAAIAAYQQATTLQPDYAPAHQNLAVAYVKTGQMATAIVAFNRALALLDSQDPAAALALRQGIRGLGLSSTLLGQLQ